MFTLAQSKCPNTKIVAGGYSQGAALIAGAVSGLDDDVKSMVKGVVLYGYTKNLQNDGSIPDYPKDQTKVFCNVDDGVCSGSLVVTAGHLTYTADVDQAVQFLEGKRNGYHFLPGSIQYLHVVYTRIMKEYSKLENLGYIT